MPAMPKPLASERRLKKHAATVTLKKNEGEAKREARIRDGHKCRFPLCGCRRFRFPLEVSHHQHKGAGGNPSGDRSRPAGLITLCVQRHQEGIIARHKGTLRIRPLTRKGMNGPVAFDVDAVLLARETPGGMWTPETADAVAGAIRRGNWFEVARETGVQQLEPLTSYQRAILMGLAQMHF